MTDIKEPQLPDFTDGEINQAPVTVNPLLARIHMPGSTFKLPS
ncbi:hypothetical protein MNBD_GAMMA08-3143, partial [hydrothermal vent metagenome]